jgi:hypothetical protein
MKESERKQKTAQAHCQPYIRPYLVLSSGAVDQLTCMHALARPLYVAAVTVIIMAAPDACMLLLQA